MAEGIEILLFFNEFQERSFMDVPLMCTSCYTIYKFGAELLSH